MDLQTLKKIILKLSLSRPIFHSEFDFQHELAMLIKSELHPDKLRLEIPISFDSKRYELDILLEFKTSRIGIELKYATSSLPQTFKDEQFSLKEHNNSGARYDFLKDVTRLENLKKFKKIDKGYAIFLSNVSRFHSGIEEKGRFKPIDLKDERKIKAGKHYTFLYNIKKDIKKPLIFSNYYILHWEKYGIFDFRYLLLEI